MATIDSRTEKTTIANDDILLISDSAASQESKKVKLSTIKSNIQNINGLTAKTLPIGNDETIINDSADSNNPKKVTLTNLTKGLDINGQTEKTTIIDNDEILMSDSASSNTTKKVKQSTIKTQVLSGINGLTEKTSIVDDDQLIINDSADSNNPKKIKYSIIQNSIQSLKTVIVGLVPSNNGDDLASDLDFTAGYTSDDTHQYIIPVPALTKQLDATVADGDDAGMLDTGSKAISTTYYIFARGKSTDPTAGDYIASTSSTSPSMPSGWDIKQLIGIAQTDGSGNIYRGMWWREKNKIHFRYRTRYEDRPLAVVGGSEVRNLVTSIAPINSFGNYILRGFCGDPAGSSLEYGATFEEDLNPGLINPKVTLDGDYGIGITISDSIYVDNNRQIFFRCTNVANTYILILCISYYYILS